jgi:hypothetical protein
MGPAGIFGPEFECHGHHRYFSLSRDQTCAGNESQEKRHHESEAGSHCSWRFGAHGQWGKCTTPDKRSNARSASVAYIRASLRVCPKRGASVPIELAGTSIVPKSGPRAVPDTLRVMSSLAEVATRRARMGPESMPGSFVLIAYLSG